jgi:hypothetical protein
LNLIRTWKALGGGWTEADTQLAQNKTTP